MPSRQHAPARAARTSKTISNVSKSSRPWLHRLTVWIAAYAIQAGREIRVMVKPEVINDEKMTLLARDICKKIEEDLEYPGQIKVNMIRESRAVDFAK